MSYHKRKSKRTFFVCFLAFVLNLLIFASVIIFSNNAVSLFALDSLALADDVSLPKKIYYSETRERYVSGHANEKPFVTLRKKPSAKSEKLAELDNGTVVTVRSDKSNDGWYLVTTDYNTGWVKATSLYKTFKDYTDNVKPDKVCSFQPMQIIIHSDLERMSLIMRKGPNKDSYAFIRRAPNGAYVNLVGTSKAYPEWSYIEYRGTCGWVLNDCLYHISSADKYCEAVEPTYTANISGKIKKTDSDGFARIYIGPSAKYVFCDLIEINSKVTILGSKTTGNEKWYCIRFKSGHTKGYYNETGWIHSKYVEKI